MLITAPTLGFLRRQRLAPVVKEFLAFGYKQARACIFAGSFFGLLFISTKVAVPGLARYDLILIGALTIQIVLVATRVES